MLARLQTTLAHVRRCRGRWLVRTLCALVLAALLAGCDRGRNEVVDAQARAEDLCALPPPDFTPQCPPCSAPDESGQCRDAFYPSAIRCFDDRGCRGGRCDGGLCVFRDDDRDDLDDRVEQEVAERNLPAVHLHSAESCAGPRGILFRARRHPAAPTRLAITYVVLYARDCGLLNGHIGDNEAFAITVDLGARPGAPATVGLLADAHRGTACESLSTCETRPGTSACAPPGAARAVIYSSRDKHANYLSADVCARNCFDSCDAGPVDPTPRIVDVGQPNAPLANDLSTSGLRLVSLASGWSAGLLHYNPWSARLFGGAGFVRDQLLSLVAPPGL